MNMFARRCHVLKLLTNNDVTMSRRQVLIGISSAALLSLHSFKQTNSASLASSQPGKQSAVEPIHYSSLLDIASRIQSREISPVELTTHILDRIAAVDPKLRSYATVMREQALGSAKRAVPRKAGRVHRPCLRSQLFADVRTQSFPAAA